MPIPSKSSEAPLSQHTVRIVYMLDLAVDVDEKH